MTINKLPGDSITVRLNQGDIDALGSIADQYCGVSGIAEIPGTGPMLHWALEFARENKGSFRRYIAGKWAQMQLMEGE